MTTPTHVAADIAVFLALTHVPGLNPNTADFVLLIGSNLIDIDHLFSHPIYHPRRNPFTTHTLHKSWLVLGAVSCALLFIRPLMFIAIGLLLHFALDYLYVRWFVMPAL